MRYLLLGGTDLTLAVAERLRSEGMPPCAVVGVGRRFKISYKKDGVENIRYADLPSWCDEHRIPYVAYDGVDTIIRAGDESSAELALAAGWFHMIPERVRSRLRYGAIGIHNSLLPDLRGGAPLNWAILLGRSATGCTIFRMGDGVDDGPILAQRRIPLAADTTIGDLVRMAQEAALEMLPAVLRQLADGSLTPTNQIGEPVYCLQRTPEDGKIVWNRPAETIARLVRAVSRPYPGAWTTMGGKKLTIWRAEWTAAPPIVHGAPGQIAHLPGEPPSIVTGEGRLVILEATDETGEDVIPMLRSLGNSRLD